MSRLSSPALPIAQRILLMIVLIASFGFIEVDDAEASDIKKKTLKSGAVKTAGRTNTTANVNTLLHGIGAPSASLGINGDFFIDTLSMNIYGPKTKNAWPLPKSLIGPQGTAGAMGKSGTSGKDGRDGVNGKDGANGRDGDRGSLGASSSGSGSVGPQGPQGPQGPAGLSGPIGPTGPAGVAGAQGLPGAAGAPGTPGATGSPGIQGDTGPRGLQGLQGDAGAEGTAGATGPRGAQGIAGPVQIYFSNVSFTGTLSGNVGTSKDSDDFGSLVAGKKYLLTAYIYSQSAMLPNPSLGASVYAFGASVVPVTKYSTSLGLTYRDATEKDEAGISIISTIDGSNLVGANYQLRITISSGSSTTGTNALTLRGFYLLQEVSAIN